jgi:two-component system response regulator RegX3
MVIRRSRVLLADPDAGIRRLIQRRLKAYKCLCTETATLPEIRGVAKDPLILCLVPQAMADSVSVLLDQGADDCLVKPFLASELGARLHRLLHRQDIVAGLDLLQGTGLRTLKLVTQGGYVETDRGRAALTARQVTILAILIRADGAAVRASRLIEAAWGNSYTAAPQSLHRSIALLRQKLEVDPARPSLIVTVRGVGYRIGGPVNDSP